jgi:hypothetical protein
MLCLVDNIPFGYNNTHIKAGEFVIKWMDSAANADLFWAEDGVDIMICENKNYISLEQFRNNKIDEIS